MNRIFLAAGLCMTTQLSAPAFAGDEAAGEVDLTADFSESLVVSEPLASDGLSSLDAGPDGFHVKNGAYIIGYLAWANVDGDFDGSVTLAGAGVPDTFSVPDLDESYAYGGGMGIRWGDAAFEVTYQRSEHDATFGGAPLGDAILNTINFDLKYYFMTDQPLQPFVLVGVNVPWMDVDNGSFNIASALTGDASYIGFGANFGGGAAFYLTPKLAVTGSAGYRLMYFDSVKGIGDVRADINGNLEAHGFFVRGGVTLTF